MGVSIARDITKLVTFDIDHDMPAQSDYTFSIGITRSDWETAFLRLWGTNTGKPYRRSMFIVLMTSADDSYSQSIHNRSGFMPRGYLTYVIENWDYSGFSYATNSALSRASYGYYGKYVYLKSTVIDATNIKLLFHNHRAAAENLKMSGVARFSRKMLK